jgi:hypothetical protein
VAKDTAVESDGMEQVEKCILSNAVKHLRNDPVAFEKAFAAGLALHLDRLYGTLDPSPTQIAGLTEKDCTCKWMENFGIHVPEIDLTITLGKPCGYHALLKTERASIYE